MAKVELSEDDVKALEKKVRDATGLPWQFTGASVMTDDYAPIFGFTLTMDVIADTGDASIPNEIRVTATAQSHAPKVTELYGVTLTEQPIDTLKLLRHLSR